MIKICRMFTCPCRDYVHERIVGSEDEKPTVSFALTGEGTSQ